MSEYYYLHECYSRKMPTMQCSYTPYLAAGHCDARSRFPKPYRPAPAVGHHHTPSYCDPSIVAGV